MHIDCPHCQRTLEFSGEPPRFCAYCGQSLSTQAPEATADYDAVPPTLTTGVESASHSTAVPDVIGGYRLIRTLGGGGMGTVYEAEQTTTSRRVALKLISPQFAGSHVTVERFRQEGRLASAIAHPRCVFVVAADEEAGRPYIVMELMPGDTLEDLIRREGPLPPKKAVGKILDVVEGLLEAHRQGVIHRDVKPSNCFLEKDGRVKIGDFGLSKSLASDQALTKTGSFLGTVLYSSPEQVRRDELDQQTDVYSVAATLYFLLTGRAPYQTGDAMATIAQILSEPPTPPRQLRPDLPPALERVLLKGLERNRDRRYRDLAEFRDALMPFLRRELSIGSVGWRLLAYLLDIVLLWGLGKIISFSVLAARGHSIGTAAFDPEAMIELVNDPLMRMLPYFNALIWLLYFAALEGLCGCTLGKWLLRLRIMHQGSEAQPGWGRNALRTLACFVLTHLDDLLVWGGTFVGLWSITYTPGQQYQSDPGQLRQAMWVVLLSYGGFFAGIGLLVCTMRARNGHQGLHEWLSGTRVVRLPEPPRSRSLWGRTLPTGATPALSHPPALPERVGPFVVHGALRWSDHDQMLLGEDAALRRKVWIWLRPGDQPALSQARQNLSRTSRLRWLSCGTHDGRPWDAFVAPAGCSLANLVAARGAFSWPEAKPILGQLSYELSMACQEWTLPEELRLDQVWIQPNDRVLLLDTTCTAAVAVNDGVEVVATPQERSLKLLAQVAVLALEGRPRAPQEKWEPMRAPVPGHASDLLQRLLGVDDEPLEGPKEFIGDLEATFDRPDEVSRVRRFVHLLTLMAFCSYWLWCCVPTHGVITSPAVIPLLRSHALDVEVRMVRQDLEEGASVQLATTLANGDPFAQLSGVALYESDRRLGEQLQGVTASMDIARREMVAELSTVQSWVVGISRQAMAQMKAQIRETQARARQMQGGTWDFRQVRGILGGEKYHLRPFDLEFVFVQIAVLCIGPVLFVLWAFVIRGGLSYRLAGIAIVRRDGRPAWRLQCLLRAFLVWAPVTGLLAASLYADGVFWSGWSDPGWRASHRWLLWLATFSWYAGLGLLLAGAALAIAFPRRSLHDWLAGTYLVPR